MHSHIRLGCDFRLVPLIAGAGSARLESRIILVAIVVCPGMSPSTIRFDLLLQGGLIEIGQRDVWIIVVIDQLHDDAKLEQRDYATTSKWEALWCTLCSGAL